MDINSIDYSAMDRPEILMYLFHPRPEIGSQTETAGPDNLMIPTEAGIEIGAAFHLAAPNAPTILFFHGNGEIVSDYNDMGPIYNQIGINFLPVDYRGYGRSSGTPTVTGMMRDCHYIFRFLNKWLPENGLSGPLVVMGRSLGSASALEIAGTYSGDIDGLIIESGFAYALPLLRLLGVDIDGLGLSEDHSIANIARITSFTKPTLIIHAEHDHIIPYTDGSALYQASEADDKQLVKIAGADHNTIFYYGAQEYFNNIQKFISRMTAAR